MSNHLQNYQQLMQEYNNFLCNPATLLADVVLLSFMNDVLESVQAAMCILQNNTISHRAFPSVRTAFEASQQAIVLVTQDDYSFVGAKAWVYYLRRDKNWLAKTKPDGSGINSETDAEEWYKNKIKDIAIYWGSVCSGKSTLVEQARIELDRQPRKPDNWLGKDMALAQDEAYQKITSHRGLANDPQKMSMTNRTIYSSLSRETHTGLKINTSMSFQQQSDGIKVAPPERDNAINLRSASASAMSSVSELLLALEYRKDHYPL